MSSITTIENTKGGMIEQVLIKGDLSSLSPEQRSSYYLKVCESVGLNPLTKPLEFINLNGKLTLYALRGCTDQLRTVHGVSVTEMTETEREGVFIVTVKVQNKEGRTDMAKGAVTITGLKGENLANALMKAETKAKRRATLSLCGLGLLDESEVETIPNAVIGDKAMTNITPSDTDATKPPSPFKTAAARKTFQVNVTDNFHNARSHQELTELMELDKPKLDQMNESGSEADELSLGEIRKQYQIAWNRLLKPVAEEEVGFNEDDIPEHLKAMGGGIAF